ncbi:MAG TPA: protoporphyrinogen oxidase [Ornithinibacter sp.]|nr:protoporphyrinogen oxidase [Ornithinibacter sp.]
MAKLTFIAGLAAGYVLGARAGRQRYEQIARTSSKVWHSRPVQKQVANAKEAARTKAAPAVADIVADAARATGQRLRASRTVSAETITASPSTSPPGGAGSTTPAANGATTARSAATMSPSPAAPDPWAAATSRTDGAA